MHPSVTSESPFRVRLRYAAFDTFIEKFGPNVTRGGVFLASKTPFPVGTTFAFEIQLAGGEVALAGDGKVTWIKPFDPATPQKAHGMGVQFLRLDAASRELLGQILSRKTAGAAGAVRAPIAVTTTSSNHRRGTNGTSHLRVDTNVDLASEMGVDETRLRRAAERYRIAPGRAVSELDELETLLKPEPVEPAGIEQALAELPRLLDAGARRRTGGFRTLGDSAPVSAPGKPDSD